MWVAMTWKAAVRKAAPDYNLSFTPYPCQDPTRVGRLSRLGWNHITGELPGEPKLCASGRRRLAYLTLEGYCTIYKANPLCPREGCPGIPSRAWGVAQRAPFSVAAPLNLSFALFHVLGSQGRNFYVLNKWVDHFCISLLQLWVGPGGYSPLSMSLQLKHWWEGCWDVASE